MSDPVDAAVVADERRSALRRIVEDIVRGRCALRKIVDDVVSGRYSGICISDETELTAIIKESAYFGEVLKNKPDAASLFVYVCYCGPIR